MLTHRTNVLCRVDAIISPLFILAYDFLQKETISINLLEGYELGEQYEGEYLYFDGLAYPQALYDATCYLRDEMGCVKYIQNYIQPKKNKLSIRNIFNKSKQRS